LPGDSSSTVELTVNVVSAYIGNYTHKVAATEVAKLIETVHHALIGGQAVAEAPQSVALTKAQIRKSITDNALISFVDGKHYKMLARHLNTQGLTPEKYRTRYGLPADYPMTAPAYSEHRSALAKASGLGRKVGRSAPVSVAAASPAPPASQAVEAAPKAAKAPRKPRAPKTQPGMPSGNPTDPS
jgi:predicted transcriptional regulator